MPRNGQTNLDIESSSEKLEQLILPGSAAFQAASNTNWCRSRQDAGAPRRSSTRFFAFVLVLLAFLCANFNCPAQSAPARAPLIMVYDRGSMKEVYQDNAAAKVNLSELQSTEHLYALGPLSKLRGEIMIIDSLPFESRISGGRVQIKSDWNESAAFLIWSSVPKWRKMRVPSAVLDMRLFESWLSSMVGFEDAPLRGQFPFLLKGNFDSLEWHLANQTEDGAPLSAEKHNEQMFHGKSKNLHAEIVGFYSPDHEGLFIPQGRSTHMHVKSGDDLMAHVDNFEPKDDGLTLYVPCR